MALFKYVWVFYVALCYNMFITDACQNQWFGPNLEYKCHCTNNSCDCAGGCTGGARCSRGWFGPACQYQDLAVLADITADSTKDTSALVDGDIDTCVTATTINVTWGRAYPITWIRVQSFDQSHSMAVKFKKSSGDFTLITCDKETVYKSDNGTVDFVCELQFPVVAMSVSFTASTVVCSIYISGGRNVALKQPAEQSSLYTGLYRQGIYGLAPYAVDGNTNSSWNSSSCAHTSDDDLNPYWKVTFIKPYLVNRYVIFNRFDQLPDGQNNKRCCPERLQGFTLQTVSSETSTVFSFRDTEPEPQLVYTVTGSPHKAGAVWIQPRSAAKIMLTLCEVQVFGDSLCAAGYYGLDCQQHCNCAGPANACFVATGSCMDGCRPGYQGEDCSQACRPGRWGKHCAQICSSACAEQSCDHVTGVCDRGCVGALPPLCTTECKQGYYGINCTLVCPPHCKDGACNMSSGSCPHCEPGYTGDFCTQVCPDKTFGPACLHRCSDHCQTDTLGRLEVCHHVTGTCILGCHDGYEGLNCTKATETHPLTSVFIGVSVSVGGSVSTVFNTSWPIG